MTTSSILATVTTATFYIQQQICLATEPVFIMHPLLILRPRVGISALFTASYIIWPAGLRWKEQKRSCLVRISIGLHELVYRWGNSKWPWRLEHESNKLLQNLYPKALRSISQASDDAGCQYKSIAHIKLPPVMTAWSKWQKGSWLRFESAPPAHWRTL